MIDIAAGIFSLLIELLMWIYLSLKKPFKFLISDTYRVKINEEWKGKNLGKLWYILGGFINLMIVLVLLSSAFWYFFLYDPSTKPKLSETGAMFLLNAIDTASYE